MLDELEEILKERTAGSPTDRSVRWTHLTVSAIARRLSKTCVSISRPVVARLCREKKLKKRQQVKSVTKAPSRNRDEQFLTIDRLKTSYRRSKDAILSIDSKQKELLGNVFRPGDVLADGPVEVLDHALPSYAQAEVITHGIYAPQRNVAHMNLNTSHDTGAFSCHSLHWFWEHIGCQLFKSAKRILLLLDCGGSNSNKSSTFKWNLGRVSAEIGLPIQVAHYPVYCSKYNPIERRVFPWVERAYRGQLFTAPSEMVEAIESKANTSTGLKTTAHVIKQKFRPATKKQLRTTRDPPVEFPIELPEYNYRVTPELHQQ